MIGAHFEHVFHVISRSGKSQALLGRADIDEDETASALVARMAAVAHSPLNDAIRHDDLMMALQRALEEVEMMPGNPQEATWSLNDGRGAKVTRTITI